MRIKRLRITIEPCDSIVDTTLKTLRVETITDGVKFSDYTSYYEDDFESRFDYMINEAKRSIAKAVKEHELRDKSNACSESPK